jgi:large subunit ribosomal protein L10
LPYPKTAGPLLNGEKCQTTGLKSENSPAQEQYEFNSPRSAFALEDSLLITCVLPASTQEWKHERRNMAKTDKSAVIAELTEDFRGAGATIVTEYRGLSVTSMKTLRRTLGGSTKYSVAKNTLMRIAAKNAGVEISDELLKGPSAVAFINGDPIDAARSLRDFANENPALVIKGGIYEGKLVTTEEIMKLANLESREVLLAKLAGAMKGSLAKAVRVFDALRIKMESGSPLTAQAADATASAPAEVEAEAGEVQSAAVEAPEAVEPEATPAEASAQTEAQE